MKHLEGQPEKRNQPVRQNRKLQQKKKTFFVILNYPDNIPTATTNEL